MLKLRVGFFSNFVFVFSENDTPIFTDISSLIFFGIFKCLNCNFNPKWNLASIPCYVKYEVHGALKEGHEAR